VESIRGLACTLRNAVIPTVGGKGSKMREFQGVSNFRTEQPVCRTLGELPPTQRVTWQKQKSGRGEKGIKTNPWRRPSPATPRLIFVRGKSKPKPTRRDQESNIGRVRGGSDKAEAWRQHLEVLIKNVSRDRRRGKGLNRKRGGRTVHHIGGSGSFPHVAQKRKGNKDEQINAHGAG